jgi:DNA-binding response OmpR family regulator
MRTVLIADAAASVRELVRSVLAREDVVFAEAADATEALVVAVGEPLSLVLLDVDLPPAGGLEVLARIRGVTDVPVVMLALRDHAFEARTLFARGADEILLKPLETWRLVAVADAALGPDRSSHVQRARYG